MRHSAGLKAGDFVDETLVAAECVRRAVDAVFGTLHFASEKLARC